MVLLMLSAKPSPKSILSYYASELPDDLEEFDVTIKHFFTNKATNIMKSQSDVYRYINPSKNTPHFYELLRENHSHLYFLQFRVVKIKTAGISKTGNLFPPDSVQFRHFYRKRSGRRKPEKETGWQQQVSL